MALQLPECFEASYCIQIFCFCEESLVRDTNLHNKDCTEMHSGSCSQMTSSCKCPISLSWKKHWWRTLRRHKMVVRGFPGRVMSVSVLHSSNSPTLQQRDSLILTNPQRIPCWRAAESLYVVRLGCSQIASTAPVNFSNVPVSVAVDIFRRSQCRSGGFDSFLRHHDIWSVSTVR